MRPAAIVLGGGRASRMGADKLALRLGDASLLEHVVAAASAHAGQVIVAGPRPETFAGEATFAPEDPPFGGPVAGIASALTHVADADEVLLLAGDLAAAERAVALLSREPISGDGVLLVDASGRRQPLLGRYRTEALRAAVSSLGDGVRGAAIGRLLEGLRLRLVESPEGLADDVDTPADAARLGIATPREIVAD